MLEKIVSFSLLIFNFLLWWKQFNLLFSKFSLWFAWLGRAFCRWQFWQHHDDWVPERVRALKLQSSSTKGYRLPNRRMPEWYSLLRPTNSTANRANRREIEGHQIRLIGCNEQHGTICCCCRDNRIKRRTHTRPNKSYQYLRQ